MDFHCIQFRISQKECVTSNGEADSDYILSVISICCTSFYFKNTFHHEGY
jgi:hypothetical protein